ncbi:MAG: hypothetical protein ACPG4T_18460, partial [Nannocystaceae bacterium]
MIFNIRLAPVMAAVILTACAQGSDLGSPTESTTEGATTVVETSQSSTDEPTTDSDSDTTSTSENSETDTETTENPTDSETDTDESDSDNEDTVGPPDPACGDGAVDENESCDDGNDIAGDGCNPDCRPSGELLWDITVGDDGDEPDQGYAVAVDSTGHYYVGGQIRVASEAANAWLTKYTPAGDPIWTYTQNGPANSNDMIRSIAIGPEQEVYFTGHSWFDSDHIADLWVAKLNANGEKVWEDSANTLAKGNDRGYGILVTQQGNVVVAGNLKTTTQDNNLWVRQYDAEGLNLWTRSYNGMANLSDLAQGIAAASDGSLYAAGHETDANSIKKGLLVKFSSEGDVLWSQNYGPMDQTQEFSGVAVGPEDDVYVSGSAWHEMAGRELTVHRFNPDGVEVWSYHYEGELGDGARGEALAVGNDGAIVVGGFEQIVADKRMLLLKLGPDGTQWWSHQVFGNGVPDDIAQAVAIDDDLQI